MELSSLRSCRSVLYFPASNARAIEKARQLPADMVILDCEDAVKPEDKDMARQAALAALEEGFGNRVTAMRINAIGQVWHRDDLSAAARCKADFIVLPKVEGAAAVRQVAGASGKRIIAMIETAAGVLAAAEIARASAGLIAGTNDLAADLGIPSSADRRGLAHGLQAIVLTARAAGAAAFDGVYNRLEDDDGLAAECREGRAFGFDGKTLIHPRQVEIANRCFSPSEDEVETARRMLAAFGGGAERFEGRMIEAMHVAEAELMLARARA